MIRKVCSGFPKRSCSIKDLKRDDDSTRSHRALARLRRVFVVPNRLHPRYITAVQGFLHGDVGHTGRWRSAVPMFLARRNPDDIAGPDFAYRSAFGLYATNPRDDVERLSERVRMPVRACSRLEGNPV